MEIVREGGVVCWRKVDENDEGDELGVWDVVWECGEGYLRIREIKMWRSSLAGLGGCISGSIGSCGIKLHWQVRAGVYYKFLFWSSVENRACWPRRGVLRCGEVGWGFWRV